MRINSGYTRSCSISLSFSEGTRLRGGGRKMCLSALEVTTIFFLLKHTKGSREAAFDDLCILADVSGDHAPSGISVPG